MKYAVIVIAFFLLLPLGVKGQAKVDSARFTIGSAVFIDSKYLNDSVLVYVHFPAMNESQQEYPLILLLDAYSSFKSFSSCAELMAHEKTIPSCIVVGFPQRKYTDFETSNLEFKMDKLARFIDEELFPYLEKKYTITKTIIWGQGKQSGLISSYFMLNYPDLFNVYISDIPDLSLLNRVRL